MHFNSALRHGFDVRLDQPEHRARLREHPPEPLPAPFSEDGRTLGVWRPFRDHARVWLNGSYLPYPARDRDMAGTFFSAEAVKFLEENREKPFFLVASFTEPHSPFHFPVEDAGAYDPVSMPLYAAGPGDPPQVPLIFRDLSDAEKRRITASYFTSVTFLDRNVGRVLGALERLGLAEDTLVVLAGDHGYNLGHHGRFEKHCHFEPAVRAPLIVRWPGRIPAGRAEHALAELADIAPMVLEAAGLPLEGTFHGKSLLPLLGGKITKLRDAVFSEYLENEEAMLRTERWKLIYSSGKRARDDGYATHEPTPGRTRRLYDLEADPGEMRDLSESPGHREVLRDLESRLIERFAATYPAAPAPPADLQGPDLLDWYLIPRDPEPARAKK
jgi:choline-sulfatase